MNAIDQCNEVSERMEDLPGAAVLVTPGSALIIGLSVIAAVLLLMAGGFYALERLSGERAIDRAAAIVVAKYQLAAARANADQFNANQIPGALQCLPPDPGFVHADMVVQR
jgi:hypothetical protein